MICKLFRGRRDSLHYSTSIELGWARHMPGVQPEDSRQLMQPRAALVADSVYSLDEAAWRTWPGPT